MRKIEPVQLEMPSYNPHYKRTTQRTSALEAIFLTGFALMLLSVFLEGVVVFTRSVLS